MENKVRPMYKEIRYINKSFSHLTKFYEIRLRYKFLREISYPWQHVSTDEKNKPN